MKTRMTQLTAVAAVLIAGILVWSQFASVKPTFAEVIKPILTAKTVILDLVIGGQESNPTMHEIIEGSRIRRTISNIPNLTQVLDLETGRMLALDSESKTAAMINIQGDIQEGTKNYVEFLRQVIRQVQDGHITKLGEREMEGRQAVGFSGKGQNEEVTIWADAKTGHPLRIEFTIGQEFHAFMKNFQFDAPVDVSLLSMDVPAGYTLAPANFDLTGATEADFAESLRIWADIINDGVFPDAVGSEHTMKQIPVLVQKLIIRNIPQEEGVKMGMDFGRGMLFHQMLEHKKRPWGYTGAGVKLGDGKSAVFWYRPDNAETCRVIYGDLHVEDVAPDRLPQ